MASRLLAFPSFFGGFILVNNFIFFFFPSSLVFIHSTSLVPSFHIFFLSCGVPHSCIYRDRVLIGEFVFELWELGSSCSHRHQFSISLCTSDQLLQVEMGIPHLFSIMLGLGLITELSIFH